jgi:hypothetical protein
MKMMPSFITVFYHNMCDDIIFINNKKYEWTRTYTSQPREEIIIYKVIVKENNLIVASLITSDISERIFINYCRKECFRGNHSN